MSYQTPVTIADMLSELETGSYVLPDIQREFVWSEDQIAELFDSLMRGYPIGTFLFWKLDSAHAADYRFYEFITDYSEFAPHNRPITPRTSPITAVLDGQQRLSALNIGLRGTYATRVRYGRRTDPNAYPARQLYLNVLHTNEDAAPDESMYEFKFMTAEVAAASDDIEADRYWIPVHRALTFEPGTLGWLNYLREQGLGASEMAQGVLHPLLNLVHQEKILVAYNEKGHDLDKVLNIFIRVNRGGSKLSYSDLLMSMAAATWSQRDARHEVHDLVDTLNAIGDGFDLTRDRILKSALVITDLPDIKLKAKAMKDNMLTVEAGWDDVRQALEVTVQLLADFGLSADSLRAGNAIIPIAFYVHWRNLDASWLKSATPADQVDKDAIRSWITRTLLRGGFWTGAVDTILLEARKTIKEHGANAFPVDELEKAIEDKTGKSLRFTSDYVDELLNTSYRSPLVGPLLQLLFDRAAERGGSHVDHVFPRTRLQKKAISEALAKSTRSGSELDEWLPRVDQLANLQLLRDGENTRKGAQLPNDWIDAQNPAVQANLVDGNDLETLPGTVLDWFDWFERRRARMHASLSAELGVQDEELADDE